jgi:hypothetical protein
MRDYYSDGFNAGYGLSSLNHENDFPRTDGDRYSYERGIADGRRRADISAELDREGY